MRKSFGKIDFSYFCAAAAPDVGEEELRTLCDWGNWLFPFDDCMFLIPYRCGFSDDNSMEQIK
jgi:hypothetical protein